MSDRTKATTKPLEVHVIQPTAVYTDAQATEALGLAKNTLRTEIGEGRIRVSVRCNRHYFLGEWLLEWLRTGEKKYKVHHLAEANGAGRG